MISIHLLLLGAVPVVILVSLALSLGYTPRSASSLLATLAPFLLIGVCSLLLLSVHGAPSIEWYAPMLGALLLWLFCRSDRVFRPARLALFVLCGALVAHFFTLTEGGYTASPVRTRSLLTAAKLPHRISAQWHTPLTHLYRLEVEGANRGG